MEELDAAMQEIFAQNVFVEYWINWMGVVMLASVFFIWKNVAARYVLGAFVLIMPIGYLIWHLSGNVNLIGAAHLLIWTPLAYYLIKKVRVCSGGKWRTVYGFWLVLVTLTILTSLMFDVRDLILVLMGQK